MPSRPLHTGALPPVHLDRRQFLRFASAAALAPFAMAREPGATLDPPRDIPASGDLVKTSFLNWSGEIRVPDVWVATPRTPEEVADVAAWAHAHGWQVRPRGMGHGWSPLLMTTGRSLTPTLLVDATRHLDQVWVGGSPGARTVRAQAGVSLDRLWETLGEAGLAMAAIPAPGGLTLGGALAVGGHGTILGAGSVQGWTYGTLSNAVLSLDAVVWDPETRRYRVRTFAREDAAIGALLVHAGRAFVTEATLQVGEDVNLRCQSHTHLPVAEVFAAPAAAGEGSFQALAQAGGRIEVTWFPYSDCPWVRVWSETPQAPGEAWVLDRPYPFTFANWMDRGTSDGIASWLRGNPAKTPDFLRLEMAIACAGLAFTGADDVWGPSRFSLLHVQASTLRYHVSGHAILCRAADIQKVVSELYEAFTGLLDTYRSRDLHPVNGPLDIRLSGLDHAEESAAAHARECLLSPVRPRADHPEWDCAVWVEILTLPGTAGATSFYTDFEAWMLDRFQAPFAAVRVEWAKGWAYSPQGPWTRTEVMEGHIPASFDAGAPAGAGWAAAVEGLRALDPGGVFGNPFLERLFRSGG